MKTTLFALLVFGLLVETGDAQLIPAQPSTQGFQIQLPQLQISPPQLNTGQFQVRPSVQQPQRQPLPPVQGRGAVQGQPPAQYPPQQAQFPPVQQRPQPNAVLSNAQLRDIDTLVVRLQSYCKSLHDEFHEHFKGERHAAKLDEDVTALERLSDGLHAFATKSDGSVPSAARIRHDTNQFLQLAVRIMRTIELTEPWLRSPGARTGIHHMRTIGRGVLTTAHQIDAYLPVDPQVIDGQTENLEAAVKELHDEFHEHLENYEVSRHLDEDLEAVESLVEHIHEMAHNKTWGQINFNHLTNDLNQVKQKTAHIESLFVRQAQIGVRSRDWIGIEHSRDAISDVLASSYLLEHMIRKTVPQRQGVNPVQPIQDTRPRRDRHGHPVRDSRPDTGHDRQFQQQWAPQPRNTQPQYRPLGQ